MNSSEPLRLYHALAPGDVGGVESIVEVLAAAQARRNHEVGLLLTLDEDRAMPAWAESLADSGIDVRTRNLRARAYLQEFAWMRNVLRSSRPHVLHTHGYRADVVGALAAWRARVPVVTTVHGFTGGGWKNRFYETLQRLSYRRFDRVVAVSRPLRRELARAGIAEEKLCCLPNAWRPRNEPFARAEARRRLRAEDEKTFLLGWVGRLSHEKAPDIAVRAIRCLADIPCRLLVLGDGPLRSDVEELVRRDGMGERVHLLGTVPEAFRLFPAFDGIVLSSRTEGTPVVLLEASWAGVPVVATAVGGVPAAARNREVRLVPAEDVTALAEGIRALWRERESARARATRVARFLHEGREVQEWVSGYDRIYRDLLGHRPSGSAS